MEPTIITWNATNWATVFLMVLGGFLVLKCITLGVQKVRSNAA
jgi:hypothetical protein